MKAEIHSQPSTLSERTITSEVSDNKSSREKVFGYSALAATGLLAVSFGLSLIQKNQEQEQANRFNEANTAAINMNFNLTHAGEEVEVLPGTFLVPESVDRRSIPYNNGSRFSPMDIATDVIGVFTYDPKKTWLELSVTNPPIVKIGKETWLVDRVKKDPSEEATQLGYVKLDEATQKQIKQLAGSTELAFHLEDTLPQVYKTEYNMNDVDAWGEAKIGGINPYTKEVVPLAAKSISDSH